MQEVIRTRYIRRLEAGKDQTDVVKVITGMRRSGKTVLMKQFRRILEDSGVPKSNIVYMNFESFEWDSIETYRDLLNEIYSRGIDGRVYVLLDEVQRVEDWEKAVNSLQVDADADIYLTGSNAFLLSSNLSTYISGRYSEVNVLSLSFSEFLQLHPGDRDRRFDQYLRTGSLPVIDPDGDAEFEHDLLIGIINTVMMKDVLTHTGSSNIAVLTDVARFLFSNVGSITSCNAIAEIIKEDPRQVKKYLRAMADAFLIYKVERYDIRGKKLLDSLEKYYVTDTGMRNAVLGIASREDFGHLIENVVFLELKRRGYEVAVGKYGGNEVDFTARKGGVTEYFQVTPSMMSDATYDCEIRPFRMIRDSYSKTVLSMDKVVVDAPDGIRHLNLVDWLLDDGLSQLADDRACSGPRGPSRLSGMLGVCVCMIVIQ